MARQDLATSRGRAGEAPDPRTTIQGSPRTAGLPVKSAAQVKPTVGAERRPLSRSRRASQGTDSPGSSSAHFYRAVRPWISINCPRVWPRLNRSQISANRTGRQVPVLPAPLHRVDDDIAWRARASANARGARSPVIKSTACVADALSKGTLDTLMEPAMFVTGPARGPRAGAVGNDTGVARSLRFGRGR